MRQNTKNRKVLIIVAMLVLLATVFAMSGMTFAKYVSNTAIPTKQATVAKWGWIISTNSDNLFGTNYGDTANDKGLVSVNVSVDEPGTSVSASGTSNRSTLVAPGTTGYLTFTVHGTAEVKSKVTIKATGTDTVYLTDTLGTAETTDDITYSPIKWTLTYSAGNNSTYTAIEGCTGTTLQACLDKINALTGDSGKEVAANTEMTGAGTYMLTWEWAFDNTANTGIDDPRNAETKELSGNECDTLLGQVGTDANLVGKADTDFVNFTAGTKVVNINVSINVEQVQ